MTFFGTTEHFSGRTGALRWSILVGKQKHNVQKPTSKLRLHERFLSRAGDTFFFFQILSRRLCARVATIVTNFGDKLKAARITYFKRPGHLKQTFLLKFHWLNSL